MVGYAFRLNQRTRHLLHADEQDISPLLFVVVYLYDIVIYNNILKEHVEHLKKVFQVLRENQLFIK
uniref:Reverse transcriptase domain-containing protein n=1 Tax=Solanum lycopersicum TaxID=4081 RepID=A0A3Q7HKK0_SOLLC